MRIHIKTSPNTEVVPYNYQRNLVGAIHQWLGENDQHDKLSLYSFSWLQGSTKSPKGWLFPEGAQWFISAYEPSFLQTLIRGIQENPEIAFGLTVEEIQLQNTFPFQVEEMNFRVASPVFIKKRIDHKRSKYIYFDDSEASNLMTATMQRKLQDAGMEDNSLEISFDKSYKNPEIKGIEYSKGKRIKGSVCPIIIKGKPESIAFAWKVGVGHSTGIGFGALV